MQQKVEYEYLIPDTHEGHDFHWVINVTTTSDKPVPTVVCSRCNGTGGRTYHLSDSPDCCQKCNGYMKYPDPEANWKPKLPEAIDSILKPYRNSPVGLRRIKQ